MENVFCTQINWLFVSSVEKQINEFILGQTNGYYINMIMKFKTWISTHKHLCLIATTGNDTLVHNRIIIRLPNNRYVLLFKFKYNIPPKRPVYHQTWRMFNCDACIPYVTLIDKMVMRHCFSNQFRQTDIIVKVHCVV